MPGEVAYSTHERAKHFRDRAAELRAMSDGVDLAAARKSVGRIAAVFEKLAEQVEQQSR